MNRIVCLTVLLLLPALAAYPAATTAPARSGLTLATAEPLYPRTLTATGRVQPLLSAWVGSRVSGTIAGFGASGMEALEPGMRVEEGQVLFRLDPTPFQNTLAVAEAAHQFAVANAENLRAPTRPERMAQLEQAVSELETRLADKIKEVERYRRLVEVDKSLPVRRLEEVEVERQALEAQKISAEARLREARNGPTATEIAVAMAQVRQAEAAVAIAQKDLADAVVRAPFAGIVTQRRKGPGDYIANMPPAEVVELVSLDRLEVEMRLPEAYFPMIQAGRTPVELRSALLTSSLQTTLGRVVAEIDPSRGTFAVRVTVPSGSGLVPGAFVTAEIALTTAPRDVIVPQRAVVTAEGRSWVFVADNGRMRRRAVELGDRLTEGVIVRSGLEPGVKVLVGPVQALQDDAPLPADVQP